MTLHKDFSLKLYKMRETRVFRDAVYDYIHVDYLPIWYLINSREVQRLRRIKQLGGTYQVYQSAEHSRFTHSLGVYEVVRKMINEEALIDTLSDYDKLVVMCAGLLHDIGHGPFSHSFESAFHMNHEEMSVRIIREDSEVHQILEKIVQGLSNDVALVIEKKYPNPILIQMVSSQLDADRMDYLLRDSYMAGVTYGKYDMSRILRTMRVKDGRIVFKESGVQAIENYILARYHMYWQVYYHPTARAYEHMLQSACHRITDLYNQGYQFHMDISGLIPFIQGNVSVEDYIFLDETVMFYYFKMMCKEPDPILKDLCTRFVNRRVFKYRKLNNQKELEEVKTLSANHGYHPDYFVMSDDQKQIPYKHYGVIGGLGDIEILQADGTCAPLPERSEIVQAIVNAKEKQDKKVFYIKEIMNEV